MARGKGIFCMNLIPCINKAYVCMYGLILFCERKRNETKRNETKS